MLSQRHLVEMTVDAISNAEEIYPTTDTSSIYAYMPDEEGERYFYLKGVLKNIAGDSYDSEDMVSEISFDEKYNYRAY